jgi:cysteine synthase A
MIADSRDVFLKCEFLHPGRSHKARVARSLIDDAETQGHIGGPDKRILLERTGGNLGIGLAIEAKIRGYSLTLVTDPGYSAIKQAMARRFGATVLDRGITFPGCRDNGEAIAEILSEGGDRYHYLDQFANPANPRTHEFGTGLEIADQLQSMDVSTKATVVLVCGLGTGATMRGVGTALSRRFAQVLRIGVQPPNCDLRAGVYGEHSFQGIAVGQAAPFFGVEDLDGVVPVTEEQARQSQQQLLCRHRFDVGPSSLANFAALRAVREAWDEAGNHVFLTLLFDRGEDYA